MGQANYVSNTLFLYSLNVVWKAQVINRPKTGCLSSKISASGPKLNCEITVEILLQYVLSLKKPFPHYPPFMRNII